MQHLGLPAPHLPVPADATRDAQQLSMLLAVNQALTGTPNLRTALRRVLDILGHQDGLRSAITLVNDASGQVRIDASPTGSGDAQRARDRFGEGITARVLESGKPVIVPQVSRELMFGNRAAAQGPVRNETSFICVPIPLGRKTAGALAV